METTYRDHPRGCGAHKMPLRWPTGAMGSSPRVRGSQKWKKFSLCRDGIIPAGAGLTLTPILTLALFRDHPRGCGAHVMTGVLTD